MSAADCIATVSDHDQSQGSFSTAPSVDASRQSFASPWSLAQTQAERRMMSQPSCFRYASRGNPKIWAEGQQLIIDGGDDGCAVGQISWKACHHDLFNVASCLVDHKLQHGIVHAASQLGTELLGQHVDVKSLQP